MGMSYPFEVMGLDAVAKFLAEPRHALIATNRTGGSPQLAPVWYLYEGDTLYFAVSASSAKCRNLIRDPKVSACIDGGHPDARAVVFHGQAKILEASEHSIDALQWRIARRYMDDDEETRQYMERARAAGMMVVIALVPDKVIARDYN
jgi:PPOX class probable F420-dependent enzyme